MKKIMTILAVLATMFAACTSDEITETQPETPAQKLTFDISVSRTDFDGTATRALKTGWEAGDKIYMIMNPSPNNLLKFMTIEYDGQKWGQPVYGGVDGNVLTENDVINATDKRMSALYIGGNLRYIKSDDYWGDPYLNFEWLATISDYPYLKESGLVLADKMVDYTIEDNKVKVSLNMTIPTNNKTNESPVQVSVIGLDQSRVWGLGIKRGSDWNTNAHAYVFTASGTIRPYAQEGGGYFFTGSNREDDVVFHLGAKTITDPIIGIYCKDNGQFCYRQFTGKTLNPPCALKIKGPLFDADFHFFEGVYGWVSDDNNLIYTPEPEINIPTTSESPFDLKKGKRSDQCKDGGDNFFGGNATYADFQFYNTKSTAYNLKIKGASSYTSSLRLEIVNTTGSIFCETVDLDGSYGAFLDKSVTIDNLPEGNYTLRVTILTSIQASFKDIAFEEISGN